MARALVVLGCVPVSVGARDRIWRTGRVGRPIIQTYKHRPLTQNSEHKLLISTAVKNLFLRNISFPLHNYGNIKCKAIPVTGRGGL
jgi:hypothetical protein